MEASPGSKDGAPTICNLTYWEVSQQTYVLTLMVSLGVVIGKIQSFDGGGIGNWVWPKGEIDPFSGVPGGGKGRKRFLTNNT